MLNGKSVLLISIITFCRSLFAGEIGTEFTGVTETTKYYFFNERQEIVSDHIDALQALNLQVELNYQSPSINGRILGKARSAIDRSVSSRTGFDWKQLFLMLETENFDFRIGKIVEHWGVMESRNLVDIINPLDGFENYYNKEKVAQNTVKIGYLLPNSQVDIYVFSGFTPTEFYQHSNRLQAFDFSRSEYEVNQKMGIKDYAIRASFYYGDFEFALSSFEGTNRTPTIIESNHQWVAAYNKASQLGVDATLVDNKWLYKFEAVCQKGDGVDDDFVSSTIGAEYLLTRILSHADLSVVLEYFFDDKQKNSSLVSLNDHLFFAARIEMNNLYLSNVLAAIDYDLNHMNSYIFSLQGDIGLSDKIRTTISVLLDRSESRTAIDTNPYQKDFVRLAVEYVLN